MSVRRTDLIMLGANVNEIYNDTKHDDYLYHKHRIMGETKAGDLAIVVDGMSGKYVIAGMIIQIDYDGHKGLSYYEVPDLTEQDKYFVHDFIKEKFEIAKEPKIIVLTHWH